MLTKKDVWILKIYQLAQKVVLFVNKRNKYFSISKKYITFANAINVLMCFLMH